MHGEKPLDYHIARHYCKVCIEAEFRTYAHAMKHALAYDMYLSQPLHGYAFHVALLHGTGFRMHTPCMVSQNMDTNLPRSFNPGNCRSIRVEMLLVQPTCCANSALNSTLSMMYCTGSFGCRVTKFVTTSFNKALIWCFSCKKTANRTWFSCAA